MTVATAVFLVCAAIAFAAVLYSISSELKTVESLIADQNGEILALQADVLALQDRLTGRDGALVEALTEGLDDELEKSSQISEMRKAKRRTLPRGDAGPSATVREMKFHRK